MNLMVKIDMVKKQNNTILEIFETKNNYCNFIIVALVI